MKITVWCAARGGMRSVVEAYARDGFLTAQGVHRIASYDDGGFWWRQFLVLRALIEFLWIVSTQRVTLVHLHAAMRGSFWRKNLFGSIARIYGIPVILHLHGSEMKSFYFDQPAVLRAAIRSRLEKATRVVVLSRSWMEFINEIAPKAQVTIVPNYVPVPPLPPEAERRPHDVLFLGLLGQRKGVYELIEVFAAIRADHADAHLFVAGNGEVEEAKALVARLGAEAAITITGWVDTDAREKLLRRCGIYVLPSHNEGLPMSILEAMAWGLPVITTRVGGIPDLVTDGVDGLLIDAGDKPALTAALTSLLDDEAKRLRLAAAGRRCIEERASDRVALPILEALYDACALPEDGAARPAGSDLPR